MLQADTHAADTILNRRRFLQSLAVAAMTPSMPVVARSAASKLGPLRPDPNRIMDLPAGFSYRVVSRGGEPMADGLRVPGSHDGMAAFAGDHGRVILVCNHELGPDDGNQAAFDRGIAALPEQIATKIYDLGGGTTPGLGGTTTTVYDPATGETERQHLSLLGTEWNCAGGATPWMSWLSCEETFRNPGDGILYKRDQPHGYVFEVPAHSRELVEPLPISAMGKFEHEAAAVHVRTGHVYMTEDRDDSLFYRYLPDEPGNLHAGGKLQALAIGDKSVSTSNWSSRFRLAQGAETAVHWIDLDDVDTDSNDLRLRGAAQGAATFARGEGLCTAGDDFFITATIGGPARMGQVFRYRAAPGQGTLSLVAESEPGSLLRNPDNLVMAPFGDLLICEDTASHCGVIGIGPDGVQYAVADNAYSDSELAGVCFSPDGKTMFVNIQYENLTLAITGPWPGA